MLSGLYGVALIKEKTQVMSSKTMQLTKAARVLAITTRLRVTGRVSENSIVRSRSSLEMMSLPHMAAAIHSRRAK